MRVKNRVNLSPIYQSASSFSTDSPPNPKISPRTSIAAIFNSFKRKLAAGRLPSTPRSFKSSAETCAALLRRCSCSPRLLAGLALHGHAVKRGISSDRSVFTKLLSMYGECGHRDDRDRIFAEFAGSDLFSCNFMMADFARSGDIDAACSLFDKMPCRNVISWTTMINGFSRNGMFFDGLLLFRRMIRIGLMPNEVTFTCVISGCGGGGEFGLAESVVGMIVKTSFDQNLSVCNSLITLYLRMGDSGMARKVFDEMPERDVVSWTALLDLCFESGDLKEARRVFDEMPVRNEVSWSTMIARYSQSGNAMISGFVHNELYGNALEIFDAMLGSGEAPNRMTLSSVLIACANLPSLERGRNLHAKTLKLGISNEVIIGTALIDMYAKSGDIGSARRAFSMMPEKNEVSWTTMVRGLADSGLAEESLALFDDMRRENVIPSEPVFLSILFACSHRRLVQKGFHYFDSMERVHGIAPKERHYTAMVDLLSRAGLLREAEEFISKMPVAPESSTWAALLSGCVTHGNGEIGERAAKMVMELEKEKTGGYVLLSNMYASAGRWRDVAEVRRLMREAGLKKGGGCSWIQIRAAFHAFYSWDSNHPRALEIYDVLELLVPEMVTFYDADTY
ncbi:putative pentatricopeptide repeat-containing protein [Platanthera zijinensis]|uniref:Pentatricopeptide repeat-containing protein n=1 Tax=Platanthera zijinensis TaxID=2320716 RepID=A0AAP0B983_9ASPA